MGVGQQSENLSITSETFCFTYTEDKSCYMYTLYTYICIFYKSLYMDIFEKSPHRTGRFRVWTGTSVLILGDGR